MSWRFAPLILLLATAALNAQFTLRTVAPASVRGGDSFDVDITAESAPAIDAFGFEFRFSENLLTYRSDLGIQRGTLTLGFNNLQGNKVAPGLLRVGGYGLTPSATGTGVLCRISFQAKTGIDDVTVLAMGSTVDFTQTPILEPRRLTVLREAVSSGGMAAGDARGLQNKTITVSVSAALQAGSSIRGARARLIFNTGSLDYVDVDKGQQVPGSYNSTGQLAAAGTVDLDLTTAAAENLAGGELWQARFKIRANAPVGSTTLGIDAPTSFFVDFPAGSHIKPSVTRSGTVFVHPKGDADRSGNLTIADVVTVLLATMYPAYRDEFSDCNSDTTWDVNDLICTIQALFAPGS